MYTAFSLTAGFTQNKTTQKSSILNNDRPTWHHSFYYFTIYCSTCFECYYIHLQELATYCGFISCVVLVDLVIDKLKSHKSPGIDQILAELINVGGRTMCLEIHKLITSIWKKEKLPEEWKESIIVPIHKKGGWNRL